MKTSIAAFAISLCALLCIGCSRADRKDNSTNESRATETIAYLSDLDGLIERRVAMFLIPVNYTTNGQFTGFELKASTNNFSHSTPEEVRLQYFSRSEVANTGVPGIPYDPGAGYEGEITVDKMWIFQCTYFNQWGPGFDGDVRSWFYLTNSVVWPHQLTTVAVLVDTQCLLRHPQDPEHPEDDWLINTDEELVWSYCRYGVGVDWTKYEMERDTPNSGLWRTITPIRWFKAMPEWATNQLAPYWNSNFPN